MIKNSDETDVDDGLFIDAGNSWSNVNPLDNAIIRNDGTVWSSGNNSYGQIGNATNVNATYLTQMGVTEIELNVTNERIKVGETLDVDVLKNTEFNVFIQGEWDWTSSNEEIATVDETGVVTGHKVGYAVITGRTGHGLVGKVIVNVYRNDEYAITTPQIKEGNQFTIALKDHGSVWAYGRNEYGQLGNNTTENSNEPIEVLVSKNGENVPFEDVVKIEADEDSCIAIDKNGKVYTWGLKLDKTGENELVATELAGAEDINNVGIYGNNYYLVDKLGNLYAYGKDYETITKIQTVARVMDISGDVVLENNGLVYYLSDLKTPIEGLKDIARMSAGEEHYLFVDESGKAYALGKGEYGQLGNGTYNTSFTPTEVRTEDGALENVAEVSAGNDYSIAVDRAGKVYAWGDNSNSSLGLVERTTKYAKEIPLVQDENGNTMEIPLFELVEAGENHTSLMDVDGFVYSVGKNFYGQLGVGDNESRLVFTRISGTEIASDAEEITIPVGSSKDIKIMPENAFNLKTDIGLSGAITLYNSNDKKLTVAEIEGVDNTGVVKKEDFKENYTITGQRIGRMVIVAQTDSHTKNIWVNVVNSEDAVASAKVVNGDGFSIALKADGTVWSWGANNYGQLGLGDTVNRNMPYQVTTKEEIIDISAGESHVLLLGKSGKVYSFGRNTKRQLGLGNIITQKLPVETSLRNIRKVVAIGNKSFAIDEEGKVYAFGEGYDKLPIVLGIDKNVIDITANYYLADDGIVRALSTDDEIKISLDGTEDAIVEDAQIVQISEGTDSLLLLGKDGKVYSYGANDCGQLGDNTTVAKQSDFTTVVKTSDSSVLSNVVEISAGDKYGIATTADGKVYTFGSNDSKQLGFNNEGSKAILQSNYAIEKEDAPEAVRVSAGYNHTSLYTISGNVYDWGEGEKGQLGNRENTSYVDPQLVGDNIVKTNKTELLLEVEDIDQIDAYMNFFNLFGISENTLKYEVLDKTMMLVSADSGDVMALKPGRTTIIVKDPTTDRKAIIPVRILAKGTKPASMEILVEPQVETSGSHTTTLKVDGTVWCYGINKYGELGNGTTSDSDDPVQAKFPEGTIITKIAVGENHNLALDSDGNVWVWGRNNYYQLGNNKDKVVSTPKKITSLSNIKDIACGNNTSYVVTNDGELYSFGSNANGECGFGSYTEKVTINKSYAITNVIDIKAGGNHAIALKSNGEVYTTGSNAYGELGLGSDERKVNVFTKVDSLKDVIAISAGETNTSIIDIKGNVYAWGENLYGELGTGSSEISLNSPTRVKGLSNIRYIDGGKGTNIAINNNNEIYVIGLNTSGELAIGSRANVDSYARLDTISNVMQASAGNANLVMLKTDGSVWGAGDYTQGSTTLRAKTNSTIPVRVGKGETSLGITEITVHVDGTKSIIGDLSELFNLIKLDENFADSLEFESLNDAIATVTEDGTVTGVKVGTTRVNASSSITGDLYSVRVRVVEDETQVAPEVVGGENFAAVLRADGTIWTYGYNSDGRLATGNNISKDVPTQTSGAGKFVDVKAGKDFIIALKADGTVYSAGNNTNGQLGDGTTTSNTKLTQIKDLSNIVKIAAGDKQALALDDFGKVYAWGEDVLAPTELEGLFTDIIDIAVGADQKVFVRSDGKVVGIGNILDGELDDIENAIKAVVSGDEIYILTSDNYVYVYSDGNLDIMDVSEVIDISAVNGGVMYQTTDEKFYVSGDNTYGKLGTYNQVPVSSPRHVNIEGEDTFTVGAGYNNTYVINTNGEVYAAGYNEYGSIGNGTREDSTSYVLVGDNEIKVDPETKIMKVGETEDIQIERNLFNAFKDVTTISSDEYDYDSDDAEVVSAESGELNALSIGTAHITITDDKTSDEVTITRIVIDDEKDRIAEISVDDIDAELTDDSTSDDIKYKVELNTIEDTAVLKVSTNIDTDMISIDGGENWSENGILTQEIDIPDRINNFTITVKGKDAAGEYTIEETYSLIVEKLTDDIDILQITATSKNSEGEVSTIIATPVSLTEYQVVVDENTDISKVTAATLDEHSFVSVDGLAYAVSEQSKNIYLGNELRKEVTIVVKSEADVETEYKLTIFKNSDAMELTSLTVNGKEATKISAGDFVAYVEKDCELAEIVAQVSNSLASVNIANDGYNPQISTKVMNLTSDTTVVGIKVKLNDDIKEYTLYIYRKDDSEEQESKLDMILVNSAVIEPEEDGRTYIAYIPNSETEATIRAIAKDTDTMVKIGDNAEEAGDSERTVKVTSQENEYLVYLTDENGTETDTVIIRKADSDTSLKEVYVDKDDANFKAELKDDGTYFVKVPNTYEDVLVTAVAGYGQARVQVNETGAFGTGKDTKGADLPDEVTQVKIIVKSKDGSREQEYLLNIQKESNNADLLSVEVDGTEVTVGEDGKYHYTLEIPKTSVDVRAVTDHEFANVRIQNAKFAVHEMTKQVDIMTKVTEVPIYVKAEDGTIKEYILLIEPIPDDTTIKEVVVNGKEATYVEGQNRYEVVAGGDEYNVEVTLNDLYAKLQIEDNEVAVGTDTITMEKSGETTTVHVVVTARSGLVEEEYTIVITEPSSNAELDRIEVNGNVAEEQEDGSYLAIVKDVDGLIDAKAFAAHAGAETTISLPEDADEARSIQTVEQEVSYIAEINEDYADGIVTYTYDVKVKAEDETEKVYHLTVKLVETNTNIKSVKVGETELELNDATLKDDGTYYYKINNVDNGYVSVELESEKSTVRVFTSTDEIVPVELPEMRNNISITVTAEDGTDKEYTLVIEKKSSDASIMSITGDDVVSTEIEEPTAMVYVVEDVQETELEITLTNEFARFKFENESGETEYGTNVYNKVVDFSTGDTQVFDLVVEAEDGTEVTHAITVKKAKDLTLRSVIVNSEEVEAEMDGLHYETLVDNGTKPAIVITSTKANRTIQLLNEDETVVGTANNGVLTIAPTLSATELINKYIIRVSSGEDYADYELVINQKSKETGILKVIVDSQLVEPEGTVYSAIVGGKDEYPVEIVLVDNKAKVVVQDASGNVVIEEQEATLTGTVELAGGESKSLKVIVTAENGNTATYTLNLQRLASSFDIERITVTDLEEDGETIIYKDVTYYDEETRTYKVRVSPDVELDDIEVVAVSGDTWINLDDIEKGLGSATITKKLVGVGITEVSIKINAYDGSTQTRTLQIIQLPEIVDLTEVKVDGNVIEPDEFGDYEAIVTDEFDLAEIYAKVSVDTSKVSINGENEQLVETTVDVSKGDARKLVVPIKVTAKDGEVFTHNLVLNIISHDTGASVKVNDEDATLTMVEVQDPENEEGTIEVERYVAYIGTYDEEAVVSVTANSERATVKHTVDEENELSEVGELEFTVDTSDLDSLTFETTFKVVAEDGTEKEYTIEIVRKDDDTSIKQVFVNDEELTPNSGHEIYADGTYYTRASGDTAEVKVETNSEKTTVEFNGESALGSLTQTVELSADSKITEVPVKITSENGTVVNTIIYIEKLNSNVDVLSVKVEDKDAETVTDEETGDLLKYISYIVDTLESAQVEITAEDENSTVTRVNADGTIYVDEDEVSYSNKGTLSIEVQTPDKTQTIYFKVVAEDGTESDVYALDIKKLSSDATLREVYVDGVLIEADENGEYHAEVSDINETVMVKAVANNETAHVKIEFNEEQGYIAENEVTLSDERETMVPITVRSENGEKKVVYLYIDKFGTSLELETVTLDGKEADSYNPDTYTYRFIIDEKATDEELAASMKTMFELFVSAESPSTILDFAEVNGTYVEKGKSFTEDVEVPASSEGRTFKVKATAESGDEREYYIEIARTSELTGVEYLKVNSVERAPDEENGTTYTVIIGQEDEVATVEVKSEYSYATIKIGDGFERTGLSIEEIDTSDFDIDRFEVPVVVKAADGTTIKEYNVILLRKISDTSIKLEVNDEELTADENGDYSMTISNAVNGLDIVAEALTKGNLGEYAQIDLNETGELESPVKEVKLAQRDYLGKDKIEIPIKVVAEDGTVRNSKLTVNFNKKGTFISGRILTENVDQKYISEVTVYRASDTRAIGDATDPRAEVGKVTTNEDGTFAILIYMTDEDDIVDANSNGVADVLEEKYDLVVTKPGYLSYTVTDIELTEANSTDIGEHKLIAGDVEATDEIQLDDLVALNDNFGVSINDSNKAEKGRFDLNEDGVVNKLDRNLVKANYGKKAEVEKWVKPNTSGNGSNSGTNVSGLSLGVQSASVNTQSGNEEVSLILPTKSSYTITSPYGVRVHPVTGVETKHTGIDLGVEHHSEVLSIADGEVTFAGVQNGYGNCIEVKHIVNGVTIYSFYAHLSQINVQLGDKVVQGQAIGLEGGDPETDPNPGTSTGHHLHFEIRTASGSGNDVDPNNYLKF